MLSVARRYVALGVEHIAIGVDHLLFLLALVLCLRRFAPVMLAETAFTLSHTLSFSASALGWIRVSSTAAEACIAASLVLIALDVTRPQRDAQWKVACLAFAFGLVHGLGFAGALAEVGLPSSEVPAGLIGFAGGVELGQIIFLVIAVAALRLLERVPRIAPVAIQAGACTVGGTGCFWLLERIGALG
jgi:hydrogenase/urease accessory protein HupE